jgi:hypothetical protein
MKNIEKWCRKMKFHARQSLDGEAHDRGRFFVAVHAGAGYHGAANTAAFKRALKRALLSAARVFQDSAGAY